MANKATFSSTTNFESRNIRNKGDIIVPNPKDVMPTVVLAASTITSSMRKASNDISGKSYHQLITMDVFLQTVEFLQVYSLHLLITPHLNVWQPTELRLAAL